MSVESLYESVLTAETGLYLNASALASALLDQVASRIHSKDLNQTKETERGELSLTGSMKDMITHWYIRVTRGREDEVEGERRNKEERNRFNKSDPQTQHVPYSHLYPFPTIRFDHHCT